MAKAILVAAAICVFPVAAALAADAQPATGAPSTAPAGETRAHDPAVPIMLVPKPIHDFGHVWVGDLLHTFVLKNVGEAALEIAQVKPSCGCTTAGAYPRSIPPGGSGEFPFRLASERYSGPFSTPITIESNDPAHPQTRLTLKAFIKHYVTMEPRAAHFGQVQQDAEASRTITLTNNVESPMQPKIVEEQTSETFKAQLVEVEAGRKYELNVSIRPPYQPRYNQHTFKVDTGIPDVPPLVVYCSAILPERLTLSPEVIYVAPGRTSSPRQLRFRNSGGQPVKLLSATSQDESLRVTVSEAEPGKEYIVSVAMPANYAPPPAGSEIVLKTDDATQPELRVPVRGMNVPPADTASRTQQPPQPRPKPAMQLIGRAAPQVNARTHDDKQVVIGGKTDRVQVVTFYASWCGFCRRAMPAVEKIREQYAGKPVDVIAVSIDGRTGPRAHTEEQTLGLYKQLKLSMPLVMDPGQDIAGKYNMRGTGVPAFFVIGKDGTVEAMHTGYRVATDNTLTSEIDVLLEGKTRADFAGAQTGANAPAAGG